MSSKALEDSLSNISTLRGSLCSLLLGTSQFKASVVYSALRRFQQPVHPLRSTQRIVLTSTHVTHLPLSAWFTEMGSYHSPCSHTQHTVWKQVSYVIQLQGSSQVTWFGFPCPNASIQLHQGEACLSSPRATLGLRQRECNCVKLKSNALLPKSRKLPVAPSSLLLPFSLFNSQNFLNLSQSQSGIRWPSMQGSTPISPRIS